MKMSTVPKVLCTLYLCSFIFSPWPSGTDGTNCPVEGMTYSDSVQDICYWIVQSVQNADESNLLCEERGGVLAFIPNQSALDTVATLLEENGYKRRVFLHVGYTRTSSFQLLVRGTSNIQPWVAWDTGKDQPDTDRSEWCIALKGQNALFHDYECGSELYAVCSILTYGSGEACPSTGIEHTDSNNDIICYWMVTSEQDATCSEEKCIRDGGGLAIIPDDHARSTVMNLFNQVNFEGMVYIGYRKANNNQLLIPGDNVIQYWVDWDSQQPGGDDQECIMLFAYTGGRFHDQYCSIAEKALCSKIISGVGEVVSSTVGIETTEPLTTDITTSQDCWCKCGEDDSSTLITYPDVNITEELQTKLDNLVKETKVNHETLSSTIRKKSSASDPRPSSAYVGYVGIVLLSLVFGLILLLDLPRLLLLLGKLFK